MMLSDFPLEAPSAVIVNKEKDFDEADGLADGA